METIGVQVKRYKNSIAAEQIRSLAGAMVLNSMTAGMFVTTSSFQSGAPHTAQAYSGSVFPMKIELINGDEFYKKLALSQINLAEAKRVFDVKACLAAI
jgi:restriction system protein